MRQTLRKVGTILGSLPMAVGLILLIAAVLAWGTIYEARFGTAAVQQVIYRAWWFQVLLGFLALNLAVVALQRYPWQRKHVPFVLAHIGIILILFGGILGGRFGIDGQLIIPEGEANGVLQLPRNVLAIHEPNPGVSHVFPTSFESTAWVREPNTIFAVPLKDRTIELTVDRYYPNAAVTEEVHDGGSVENPAVHVVMSHDGAQDALWLFSRDPERFGARWGEAHVLFLEPDAEELAQLRGGPSSAGSPRGRLSLTFASTGKTVEIAVPDAPGQPVPLEGTPYVLAFKDYFPDA
ncbi:MAG: cytochrome c biogenesis protein ResB, partial [Candidatus Omnitrophota bacterium]|nr:cytochrome c biogenesis protein ResB [Candidatus Omnitrophota bacterium]